MPIYVYHCSNCDYQFEQFQHFTDDPLSFCPECERPSLHKVYQPVGIVFKGKGFYATDNRSTSGLGTSHTKEESSESAVTKSEGGNNAAADKKPEAAKPEKKTSSESSSGEAKKALVSN